MTAVTPGARPADLVPGDPEEVERVALRLARVATGAGDAAGRLRALDADVWAGESAQVYRAAIGDVPVRLARAAAAFAAAAEALRAYAGALRDGQATAAAAVRMVERARPETLPAEQRSADALLARATGEVAAAGQLAARRLARAEADAPTDGPTGAAGDLALRLDAEHELTDPGHFVSLPHEWAASVAEMRYTAPHEVAFGGALGGGTASPGAGEAGWQAWAAAAEGRGVGVGEIAAVVAAGAAVAAGPLLARRRDATALGLVGLDERELRRRRDEFGGPRHLRAPLAPSRTARLVDVNAWRTRLAPTTRSTGTVQHWTPADPLPRTSLLADRSGSVDRDVRGAVLRTGRPAHEGS